MKQSEIVFFSRTSLNGKFQVMTKEDLSKEFGKRDLVKISSNAITTQEGNIYKNLNNYWISASALEIIESSYNSKSTSF